MILRRLALFLGLLFGVGATQVPEFVDQYRQRLGGAIDELASIVSRFDGDSGQQGLTQAGGIDRLRSNSDRFVQQRGAEIQDDVDRLQMLRDAQTQFRSAGPGARLATLVTHFDGRIARGTLSDFAPAIPTSAEASVCGLVGFAIGVGIVHGVGHLFRRRVRGVRAA